MQDPVRSSFLIVGDVHLSDVAPLSRLDNYRDAILSKVKFVIDTANTEKVDFILFCGDMFHRKNPTLNSHYLVRTLMHILSKASCPVISVIGNHDFLMTLDNLDKQPLSVLEEAGVIKLLRKGESFETKNVAVNSLPYSERYERIHGDYFEVPFSSTKYNVLALHQTLLPDGQSFIADYLNFSDLHGVNHDLIVCGHYHPGFSPCIVQSSGKYFCNPGAISRGSLDVNDLIKIPKILLFSVTSTDETVGVSYREIEVPAVPTEKVLDIQRLEKTKIHRSEIEAYVRTIKSVVDETYNVSSTQGIITLLHDIATPPEIVKFIESYLTLAEEEVSDA